MLEHLSEPIKFGEKFGKIISLRRLSEDYPQLERLPYSLRVILESTLRHLDQVKRDHIDTILERKKGGEIAFFPARVLLQDYTGIPLLVDLAAMRDQALRLGIDPNKIEPKIPVHLVIDHSLQTNFTGTKDAVEKNMLAEYERNGERYQFLKWAGENFKTLKVSPPGLGIVHQINVESLTTLVNQGDEYFYPDSVLGTDSHTTMVNGTSTLGWGVGGIEAQACLLGQGFFMALPEVIAVNLVGERQIGTTITDIVLHLTHFLRKVGVVGRIVEFVGPGVKGLDGFDRCTIANMAPEYGATMGIFHPDARTLEYFAVTNRGEEQVHLIKAYFEQQNLWDIDAKKIDYDAVYEFDLSQVESTVSGPKRPQDMLQLRELKKALPKAKQKNTAELKDYDVLLASISSCTNTSNPDVLLQAGILAKKAIKHGLSVNPRIKTSLIPGSLSVQTYLQKAGLLPYLEQLGFGIAGYGCGSCIGNVGELDPNIEHAIESDAVEACAILSGNRNFESRIHPKLRANFLASPPLVIAFALVGNMRHDMENEPIGKTSAGEVVFLKDIWPTAEELSIYRRLITKDVFTDLDQSDVAMKLWNEVEVFAGEVYPWKEGSTYITPLPIHSFKPSSKIVDARALLVLGDSVTTDHISPASQIAANNPAGKYLASRGILPKDFNSFGARRGCAEVMLRGGFSNPRLMNSVQGNEYPARAVHFPSQEVGDVYATAKRYEEENVPLVIFAGQEYGTGSSRDWAAKVSFFLGVKAVIAQSFERIHRSNLIGMGVIPLEFKKGESLKDHRIDGSEQYDLDINGREATLMVKGKNGVRRIDLVVRLDTENENKIYRAGGIMQYTLQRLGGSHDGI